MRSRLSRDQHNSRSAVSLPVIYGAVRQQIGPTAAALMVVLCIGVFPLSPSWAQDADSPIEPAAEKVIREMSDFLAKKDSFSFETEVLYENVWAGQDGNWDLPAEKTTAIRTVKTTIRRPDRFSVTIREEENQVDFRYDGKTLLLADSAAKAFVKKVAPANIDLTIKWLRDLYNSDPPISDLMESNLYETHMEDVIAASYIRTTRLRGKDVHQIAFAANDMDWQAWITVDDEPVPVLLQIIHRDQTYWPVYQAWFYNWEFDQEIADAVFETTIPTDAFEMNFVEDENWEREASE
ncbi:MAG: DUF2092 domain-containing protein [Rhizobiaceae bacterium]